MVAAINRVRTIAAPQRAIWDVLADLGAISSWAGKIDHSCVLNQSADGDPIGTARRLQVGRNVLVERITDFDPPAKLAYDIEGLPRRLGRVNNCWQLTPTADGGTEVTLTSTVDSGSGPLQRVTERAVTRFLAKQSDELLAGLAQAIAHRTRMGRLP